MKKYVKPELFFESFELNQQIAACDFDLVEGTFDSSRKSSCAYAWELDPSETIFISHGACTTPVENYCYQNSTSSLYKPFNS